MKNINKKILWFPAILLFISIIVAVYGAIRSDVLVLTGEIEARQIDIAAKVPGRIDSIMVKEGDQVTKDDVIAIMNSPEIEAKYNQARGAVKSAKAMLDMALNGARSEEIKAAFELYQAAKAQFEFAEKSYLRMKSLFEEHIISRQMYDEMEFKYNAARAQMMAAEQKWNMAKEGARKEQIVAAEGQYDRAMNTLREVEVYLEETKIKAPQRGEVDNILVDPGELVATGYPILSIVDLEDVWVTVFIPETQLSKFKKGAIFNVIIPAINDSRPFEFKVHHIGIVGDFATRRATNEKGSFDIKTFKIQLRPVQPIADLRPGMSARVLIN